MSIYQKTRRYLPYAVVGIAALISLGSAKAMPDLNPAAINVQMPNQIKWDDDMKRGESTAVLAGDPAKEGIYVELVKWHAHHMSRPHFHPNDRFITVISGTWWVGTGTKFDPDSTVPLPARRAWCQRHFGPPNEGPPPPPPPPGPPPPHYDGAKEEDVVLEIVGMGPATATPAEVK